MKRLGAVFVSLAIIIMSIAIFGCAAAKMPNGRVGADPMEVVKMLKDGNQSGRSFRYTVIGLDELNVAFAPYTQKQIDDYIVPLYKKGSYDGFCVIRQEVDEADGSVTTWEDVWIKPVGATLWTRVNAPN